MNSIAQSSQGQGWLVSVMMDGEIPESLLSTIVRNDQGGHCSPEICSSMGIFKVYSFVLEIVYTGADRSHTPILSADSISDLLCF